MGEAKTVEISAETYNILRSIQSKLEKFLHKKVSFDALLRVFFTINHSDTIIADLSELLREKSIDKGMKND